MTPRRARQGARVLSSQLSVLRSHQGERGSALLIVFVFAAVIAIMLYRELPVSLFEAQRQKEQLLVDRGHEYQRAIQLYYRKFRGQYPASMQQLENTNGMRFLRRRYKDPMSGKDDWRLLHAGPGGMLLDSKVNPLKPGDQAANAVPGSQSASTMHTADANAKDSFVSSQTATDSSSTDPTQTAVARLPRRPPAIAANSAGGAAPSGSEAEQDPSKPLAAANSDSTSGTPPNTPATADAQQPQNGAQQQVANAAQQQGANPPQQPGTAIMNGLQSLAGNQPPGAFRGAMGTMSAGGIAGVASQAKGSSIKRVNEQDDYSKWEFYYDPSKDTGMGVPAVQGNRTVPMQPGAPGIVQSGFNQNATTAAAGVNQPAETPADNGTDNSVVVGGQRRQAGQPAVLGPAVPQTQMTPNQ